MGTWLVSRACGIYAQRARTQAGWTSIDRALRGHSAGLPLRPRHFLRLRCQSQGAGRVGEVEDMVCFLLQMS